MHSSSQKRITNNNSGNNDHHCHWCISNYHNNTNNNIKAVPNLCRSLTSSNAQSSKIWTDRNDNHLNFTTYCKMHTTGKSVGTIIKTDRKTPQNVNSKAFGLKRRHHWQTHLQYWQSHTTRCLYCRPTINLQTILQKANAKDEQRVVSGYGADSLAVSTVSFCDVVTVDSPSMPPPASVSGAAAGSELATSAFGMSQESSVDDGAGCDAFRSGSFSMFASSNSYSQKKQPVKKHPLNSLTSRTTWISQYLKCKTIQDFNEGKRWWGFVTTLASAGPYANNLHIAPDR